MPRNALEVSIAASEKANRQLAKIIAKLGTKAHPRGRILVAYNKARRELKQVLDNPINGNVQRAQVQRILQTLEAEIQAATLEAMQSGVAVGNENIQTQTDAYGFTVPPDVVPFEFITLGTETVLEEYRQQEAAVLALIVAGVLPNLIVGDRQRQGVLRPAPIIREAVTQATRANTVTFDTAYTLVQQAEESQGTPIPARIQKILVAVIDHRTTDTCIEADGQVVDLDKPFILTETPRYADEIMNPPFHDYCRSVSAIYDPELV